MTLDEFSGTAVRKRLAEAGLQADETLAAAKNQFHGMIAGTKVDVFRADRKGAEGGGA